MCIPRGSWVWKKVNVNKIMLWKTAQANGITLTKNKEVNSFWNVVKKLSFNTVIH